MPGNTIATAYVHLVPSFDGLQGAVGKAFKDAGRSADGAGRDAGDGFAKGFGGSVKSLAGVAAAAVAGAGLKDLFTSAVGEASDLQEAGTKLQAVFGEGVGDIETFAKTGAKALGQTNLEAKNAAATFGVMGKAAGLAGKDNAKFSTDLVGLSTDLASFYNSDPSAVVEALGAGLRGEAEPMRKFGVLMDDASLKNKALSMGLISSTKDALEPQTKILAAQALIMEQTGVAQGDFAKTSGGLANQQRILAASWGDAKGKLGEVFLPAVTGVVTVLNEKFMPILDKVLAAVPAFVDKVKAAWSVLSTGQFPEGVEAADTPLVRALTFAHDQYVLVRDGITAAWNLLKTGDFTGGLGGEDSPLVNALLTARDKALELQPQLVNAWDVITGKDKSVSQGGTIPDSPLVAFATQLKDIGAGVFEDLRAAWDKLWDIGEKLWPSIQSIATSFFNVWQDLNNSGWSAFSLVWDGLKLAFDGVAWVLDTVLVPALEWLATFFEENPAEIYLLVGALTAWKIVTLAISTATWAVQAATKAWAIAQGVLNTVMNANPIALVAIALVALAAAVIWAWNNVDWFKAAVLSAWEWISNAAKWAWENVIKPVFDALSTATLAVIDFFANFSTRISEMWSNIGTWISDAWSAILTFFSELPGKIWDTLLAAAGWLAEKGGEFLGWIWNGITSFFTDTLLPWFGSLPSLLWEGLKAIGNAEIWLAEKGLEFLGWLWNGIVTFFTDTLGPWFGSLPGLIWDALVAVVGGAGEWVIDRGKELIGWIFNGITAGATAIWDWFSNTDKDDPNGLLGQVWGGITGLMDTIIGFGGEVIGWIVKGIGAAAGLIADAVSSLFHLELNDEGTGFVNVGVAPGDAGIVIPQGARGLVVPGIDPGRRDNVLMRARSGEAVMVPEWTNAIGGVGRVNRWNRAAERGNLWSVMAQDLLYGYAGGGVVANPYQVGKDAVGQLAGQLTDGTTGGLFGTLANTVTGNILRMLGDVGWALWNKLFGGSITGGLNPSQDPSSFGWRRASNIMPFNWGGYSIGVAGGTEGLWKALLDALVPQIPGGLMSLGGYENRNIAGTNTPSFHSYGLALDVNAPWNGRGLPGYGRSGQGEIPGELAHMLAAKYGMMWGGDWSYTDPMHFEIHVAPDQISGGGIINRIVTGIFNQVTGAGAEQWRGVGLQALSILGQPASLIDAVLAQIQLESSGLARNINLGDSNAARGTPSKGLVQVIDPTFAAYALPPWNKDIYDPLSNLLAGMRWAIASQGSIAAAWGHGRPYDNGGWLMPGGGVPLNLLREPEPVLSPQQWRIAEAAIDRVSRQGQRTGNYTWNVYPTEHQEPADIAREMDRQLAFSGR